MRAVIDLCLAAFRFAIQEALPAECVKKNLIFSASSNLLTINNRSYQLNKNVHIVAFGKAACGMVAGAEAVLNNHLQDGIASVPSGSEIPSGLKTKFFTGALNNLPDAEAAANAHKIAEFVKNVAAKDQIILFLISGGGSALLPSPINGITLEEKLELIQTLASSGADIKQLNLVRSALSNLKGGKLAKLGAPSKMISLIISDVIGDPIQLIASGPTVVDKSDMRTPGDVFDELKVRHKIPKHVVNLLSSVGNPLNTEEVDVNNVIVCNNHKVLQLIAKYFQENKVYPLIISSTWQGDATALGVLLAKSLLKVIAKNSMDKELVVDMCKELGVEDNLEVDSACQNFKQVVLLFGGETTVKFDSSLVSASSKGGRNQEFVLSAFYKLLQTKGNFSTANAKFAFFSLGTDGQGSSSFENLESLNAPLLANEFAPSKGSSSSEDHVSINISLLANECASPKDIIKQMNSPTTPQQQASNVIHNNLQVPYVSPILGGIFAGKAIVIKGRVQPKASNKDKRFTIDLCCGPAVEGNYRDDKALHFNPRFDYGGSWFSKSDNDIVVNSLENNLWGIEQRCTNVLAMGTVFSVRILVLNSIFKIEVNGKHLCDYFHRLPLEKISFIFINGCIHLDLVEFQGRDPARNSPTSLIPSGSLSAKKMEPFEISKPIWVVGGLVIVGEEKAPRRHLSSSMVTVSTPNAPS